MMPQIPAPPAPPSLPTVFVGTASHMDPAAMVMIAVSVLVAATLVLLPLVRALARRLEGKTAPQQAALQAEVDELRARVHELEGGQARILELEERLDFTERIIAQKQDALRLPNSP